MTQLQSSTLFTDEVGFSAAERDVQITVLLQEVQRLFEEKVLPPNSVLLQNSLAIRQAPPS